MKQLNVKNMANAVPTRKNFNVKRMVDIALAIIIMLTIGSCSMRLQRGEEVFDTASAAPAASEQQAQEVPENSNSTRRLGALEIDMGITEVESDEGETENTDEFSAAASERAYDNGYYWTEWSEKWSPDYYEVRGEASVSYEVPANGGIVYGGMDNLGRTTYAAGVITRDMRAKAKSADRQSFDASCDTISGWGYNKETVIPSANGGKSYNGWFYNRSHLIADSLGGAAAPENLVTGTRCQNVGNRDNNGGMAYTENLARNYLDKGGAWVYYSATPVYEGNEAVCRSVIVDILSDDGSINQQVEVFNVAKGHEVDYNTGRFE